MELTAKTTMRRGIVPLTLTLGAPSQVAKDTEGCCCQEQMSELADELEVIKKQCKETMRMLMILQKPVTILPHPKPEPPEPPVDTPQKPEPRPKPRKGILD